MSIISSFLTTNHQVILIKEIRVKGTYHDMGLQFGKTLPEFHRQFSPNEKQLELAWKCDTEYQVLE